MAPGIRRILAPNPSPMTYWGTNTFLVGTGRVTVIDPGPASPTHMRAILDGLDRGERIDRILVSHAHLDHSPLARPLAEATGAKVYAFGGATAGRSPVMQALAAEGFAGGGEGVDRTFVPDVRLADGEPVDVGDGIVLETLWTPGHFAGHLCFALAEAAGGVPGGVVFTGDHVMGWASTLISPPDGDLTAYLGSCTKLAARGDRVFLPAHGAAVEDPAVRLAWLVDHRRTREAQVLSALAKRPAKIPELVGAIYTDTDPRLLPAATRNVFAHLIDLEIRGRIRARPTLAPGATFERIG
ncbi:MAG TPA: MBL fold metallo-hydrolase [Rhodobacteraceae bacterium]|nr:MBL fold metallo-hydrolase [Paracoccaceae bacterium]